MFGPGRGRGGILRNDRPTEWYTAQSPRPRPMQSPQRGLYGRGFPSRGGYNHWRPHYPDRNQEPTRGILDDLVPEPQQTISDPSTDNVEDIEAQDVRYIASYTWTNAKRPTIIVPGEVFNTRFLDICIHRCSTRLSSSVARTSFAILSPG